MTENTDASLVKDCILDITLFKPDVTEDRPFNVLPSLSPVKDGGSRYGTSYHRSSPSAPTRPFRTPYMELSPTGRSIVPSGEHVGLMDWMSRAGEKNLHSPRREISRYPDARVISQNAVDIERIRLLNFQIMLRNIPNKIDQVSPTLVNGSGTVSNLLRLCSRRSLTRPATGSMISTL